MYTYYIQFNANKADWIPDKFHRFTTISFPPHGLGSCLNTFRLTIIKE